MEKLMDDEILGTLPENALKLLRDNTAQMGRIKFAIGDLEVQKNLLLKDFEDIRYSLKVEEQKMVKRYGEGVKIDYNTGNVLAPAKKSVMDSLIK